MNFFFIRMVYQNVVTKASIRVSLLKKCPFLGLLWSAFSHIRTEYGVSVQMRENADQNNFEYGHFSRGVC